MQNLKMGNKTIYNNVIYNFPDSWPSEDFESVLVNILPNYRKYKRKEISPQGKIPVIDQGLESIAGYINDEAGKYKGDLPLIIFGDHTRNIKYIDFDFAVGADGTKLLKPNEQLIEKFFYYYLRSIFIPPSGYSRHYKYLKEIKVPIPDKVIQKSIIDKLDVLLPKVQVQLNRLTKAKYLVTRFRQAILSAAVTGKLTEDWQAENLGKSNMPIDFVQPAQKIKVQFDKSHFEMFNLPEEWEWRQFWEIAEIKSNLVNPKDYHEYVLVAPDNIERNTGKLLEKKLVKEINPISAKHLFFKGQIIYSKIRPYLSKLIYADFDGLCSADMYPISPRINVRYLMIFMLSKYFLDNVSNIGTRTLLPKTNQEELNSIPVPVPSLEEQEQIVKKVDAYLEIADKIEKQIEKAEAKMSKLTQAILAKTFLDES